MQNRVISTPSAPQAIGPYSQAVRAGTLVFLSGQIGLDPKTMELVSGVEAQAKQVFANLKAVAEASGASLGNAVKLTIYMTDLNDFAKVNEIMTQFFSQPYPARATVQVAALPKGALVEADAILSTQGSAS